MMATDGRLTTENVMRSFRSATATAASDVLCDVPEVSWSEVAGLDDVKKLLLETLSWSIFQYEKFKDAGATPFTLDGKAMTAYMKEQASIYKDVIESAKISME